jgi:hypothetical protein
MNGMPMEMCLQLMIRYIYEKKGVLISIKTPSTPHEIEIFEKMIGYVFNYYNVQF